MERNKIVDTPIANKILYTLNASTLLGNILEVKAFVFVCRKVSALPQRMAHTKHKGYDSTKYVIKEVNPAISTSKVPTIASLNLQKF